MLFNNTHFIPPAKVPYFSMRTTGANFPRTATSVNAKHAQQVGCNRQLFQEFRSTNQNNYIERLDIQGINKIKKE